MKVQPVRLYTKARILGHKRSKRAQRPHTSLLELEGVSTPEDARYYLGKRVAFVFRAKATSTKGSIRVLWGKITRTHGGSGAVRAKFSNGLPAKAFGATARVMLYPSSI